LVMAAGLGCIDAAAARLAGGAGVELAIGVELAGAAVATVLSPRYRR